MKRKMRREKAWAVFGLGIYVDTVSHTRQEAIDEYARSYYCRRVDAEKIVRFWKFKLSCGYTVRPVIVEWMEPGKEKNK